MTARSLDRLRYVTAAVVLAGVACVSAILWWTREPLLEVIHAPTRVERRVGALSANVCGRAFRYASLRYRVNDGDWQPVLQEGPRAPKPSWTIELLPPSLRPGANVVQIEATAPGRATERETLELQHDTSAIHLPRTVTWEQPLDVQDGCWDVVDDGTERRVRPVPGTEGYDRIVMASGAFAGGRRVELDIVFRHFTPNATWAGFGALTLWGGHPDPDHRPRRGWRYAVAWYMRPYGPWCEFSVKQGGGARSDVFAGINDDDPPPGTRFHLVAECRPTDTGWHQRMKLWPKDRPEPTDWLECRDQGRLPASEWAVALLAHECQVEFGPVTISPLP